MKDWKGNSRSTFTTLGASNHSDTERAAYDFYATDPAVIDALCAKWAIPQVVLEPACGEGHLSKRLEEMGAKVYSSDIVDRGYGDVADFFDYEKLPDGCTAIITNPPYRFAERFVRHSLDLLPDGGWCVMFLRTLFLEGQSRYKNLFSVSPPRWVYQFTKRAKCAINGDFESISSSATAYAWFVWQKGYTGPTIIDWI